METVKKKIYSIICEGWKVADYVIADDQQEALEKLKHYYQNINIYNDDLSKASITYLNEALI